MRKGVETATSTFALMAPSDATLGESPHDTLPSSVSTFAQLNSLKTIFGVIKNVRFTANFSLIDIVTLVMLNGYPDLSGKYHALDL